MHFWSVGLETYGVRVEDPVEALRSEYGERLPIAFDLDVESTAPPMTFATGRLDATGAGDRRGASAARGFYEQVCAVHGELHLGPSTSITISGLGARGHSWGLPPWWIHYEGRAAFQLGEALATGLMLPHPGGEPAGYLWSSEAGGRSVDELVGEVHRDADRIPVAARAVVDHTVDLDIDVVAAFPVSLDDLWAPGGPERGGHVVRCLCRVRSGEGAEGFGWAEWVRLPDGARG
ncbi:MAG: hypothetical protein M5T61_08515 [Acidimicrobiia bacterium]|nr:hypothetical protein [Acidimicrobiia bacterium]